MPESKEVAAPKKTLESWLTGEEFKRQVALALPKHITPDRFVRVAMTALTKQPKLRQCDPHSFFLSLMSLSQLGLEPDNRLAHLIPFGKSCEFIVDYKGLVDLALRSGKVDKVQADSVCEEDEFEFNLGEITKHIVDFKKPRGEIYAYYAQVYLTNGKRQGAVMTVKQVEKVRKRSRAANDGPWVTDFDEMAKKTVFRRLSKWVPLSPEYRDALEADADALEEKRFSAALPAVASSLPNFDLPPPPPDLPPPPPSPSSAEAAAQEAVDDEQRQQPESPIPTVQEELAVALAEIDFKEDRFVEGLRLLGLPVAKAAKSVADLSDTACRQAFSEGIDGIILAIEGALEKKGKK